VKTFNLIIEGFFLPFFANCI